MEDISIYDRKSRAGSTASQLLVPLLVATVVLVGGLYWIDRTYAVDDAPASSESILHATASDVRSVESRSVYGVISRSEVLPVEAPVASELHLVNAAAVTASPDKSALQQSKLDQAPGHVALLDLATVSALADDHMASVVEPPAANAAPEPEMTKSTPLPKQAKVEVTANPRCMIARRDLNSVSVRLRKVEVGSIEEEHFTQQKTWFRDQVNKFCR